MNPAAFATRQKNARRILGHIINNGETSRLALAGALGLSTATVTNIVTELLERDLLYESRQEHSLVGRKSTLLQFNSRLHHVLTVQIATGPDKETVHMAVCDLRGQVLSSASTVFAIKVTQDRPQGTVLRDLITLIQDFIRRQPEEITARLYGVGISVGGMVNAAQTVDAQIINWKNMNLAMPLQAALHIPVYVEGITRVKAQYETRFLDPSEKNVLYLNLSSGVGMVHFFNGQMVAGQNGIAGEVGHISLNLRGPQCYCGNRGCFEHYCGMHNILQRAAALLTEANRDDCFYELAVRQKEPLTAELLFRAREMGSLVVHDLLCDISEYLGAGLAALYNIFDPDRVILSGYLDGADNFVIENARAEANSRIINRFSREVHLTRAHLNDAQLHLAIVAFVLTKLLDTIYP
ncbi:MAG: ROK family transcriptional regulator [Oscillospiraceae bacterium]|nr:ROK family transcriptional regulator [Oscillospiraceae bacterium]